MPLATPRSVEMEGTAMMHELRPSRGKPGRGRYAWRRVRRAHVLRALQALDALYRKVLES